MAKKKGICKNLDGDCSLAAQKTIQEVESTQFVCEECGAELYEVQDKGGKKKPKGKGKVSGALIAIIAAAVLAVGAACYFIIPAIVGPKTIEVTGVTVSPDKVEIKVGETVQLDATVLPDNATNKEIVWFSSDEKVATVDSTGTVKARRAGEVNILAQAAGDIANHCVVTVKPKEKPWIDLGWGKYEGPTQNGKAHGIQGQVTVTSFYSIDLKKAPAQYIKVQPGDQLVNCKFVDGKLVSGMLKRTNGEQVAILIGN